MTCVDCQRRAAQFVCPGACKGRFCRDCITGHDSEVCGEGDWPTNAGEPVKIEDAAARLKVKPKEMQPFDVEEPLLGPLDLERWLQPMKGWGDLSQKSPYPLSPLIGLDRPLLSWVIVGGESGPGSAERKLVERCPETTPPKHRPHIDGPGGCSCNQRHQ